MIARETGMDARSFDRPEPGDRLELPGLFQGLTGEKLRLRTIAREPHRIAVEGSYVGVPSGRWDARLRTGAVERRCLQPRRER